MTEQELEQTIRKAFEDAKNNEITIKESSVESVVYSIFRIAFLKGYRCGMTAISKEIKTIINIDKATFN